MLLNIEKQLVNSEIDDVSEVLFSSASKRLRLFLINLPDKIVAHAIIGCAEDRVRVPGETTMLYMAAIDEMKQLASSNSPIEYNFMTSNQQMKWFGEHRLPELLDHQIVKEIEDDGSIRIKWRYPYSDGVTD